MDHQKHIDYTALSSKIKEWGQDLGFQQVGITDIELDQAEARLVNWLNRGFHGEMGYMARHGTRRTRPAELVPGTVRIISTRMDYQPPDCAEPWSVLDDCELGYVSRYALGRDYHKLMRRRLQRLAERIESAVGRFGYRAFVDSAPVLEKAIAAKAGLGWIGKHSNLLNRDAGSWFFLGELYTSLPLPVDRAGTDHCGRCTECIGACPTGAIVAPYQVDARRCISYLTIELRGSIPEALRSAIGNRIYGCDDCQLVCPWNRFSRLSAEPDFLARHRLDAPQLLALFEWSEAEFLQNTAGMAIRRIGYECWLRNIAVALGNAEHADSIVAALGRRLSSDSDLVREHVRWALDRQNSKTPPSPD
jgi:epoxyqueuosine reductase